MSDILLLRNGKLLISEEICNEIILTNIISLYVFGPSTTNGIWLKLIFVATEMSKFEGLAWDVDKITWVVSHVIPQQIETAGTLVVKQIVGYWSHYCVDK